MNVPTPAVHVIGVSPSGTPWRRLTVPYGIPVGVSKAGSNLVAENSSCVEQAECMNECP